MSISRAKELNDIFPNIVQHNVGKWCTARQATENIIEPMAIGWRMRKATNTTRNMKYLLIFHGNNVTFIRTLPVLLVSAWMRECCSVSNYIFPLISLRIYILLTYNNTTVEFRYCFVVCIIPLTNFLSLSLRPSDIFAKSAC